MITPSGTTPEQIAEWFDVGLAKQADFMIVATDTFSHEDYPVYVTRGVGDPVEKQAHDIEHAPFGKVMEVYDLRGDKQKQIAAWSAWAIQRPTPGASTRLVEDFLRMFAKGDA